MNQLDDLRQEQANLEMGIEYLIISGLEDTELYNKELEKLSIVKSKIYNIR